MISITLIQSLFVFIIVTIVSVVYPLNVSNLQISLIRGIICAIIYYLFIEFISNKLSRKIVRTSWNS